MALAPAPPYCRGIAALDLSAPCPRLHGRPSGYLRLPPAPRRLPAFHDDNIIDPDLAPYMSDEGSSDDEQMSILATMNGGGMLKMHTVSSSELILDPG